jgi:hypothetical protein
MWNPVAKPFRVTIYPPNGGYNVYNEKFETFATLKEANDRVARITNPRFQWLIHQAMNPETWMTNGHWHLLRKGKGSS